jgi:hypothetical protein
MNLAEAEKLFQEMAGQTSQRKLAARLGCSRQLVLDTIRGVSPFTPQMRDRVERAASLEPGTAEMVRENTLPTPIASAPKSDDHTAWIQMVTARAIDLQAMALEAKDSIDQSEWLLLNPLYQDLRKIVIELEVDPALTEVLLPAPTDGPAADIGRCRAKLEKLRRLARKRQKLLDPEDYKRLLSLTRLRAALTAHIRRIDRGIPAAQLVKGLPWQQTTAAVCAVLQANDDDRFAIMDRLRGEPLSQVFATSLCRELEQVRSLTFPCPQYERDPVGFILRVIGRRPWEGQIRIATSVVDGKFVVVVTGHKIGKTALVAWLVWWWVSIHHDGRVMITNFTGQQLQKQDWFEIQKAHRESGICADCRDSGVTKRPCPHSQVLEGECSDDVLNGWVSLDGNRFVVGVTAKEPTAAGGYSGAHLWVICDEFSGMPYALFDGYVTGASAKSAKFLGLGNPIGDEGPMYDIVNRPALRKNFVVHSISSEEAAATGIEGLADRNYIEVMAAADPRGKESPTFLRRCGGRYPTIEEKRAFPLQTIVRAMDTTSYEVAEMDGPLILTIDPAGPRGTGDEIAMAATRGHKTLEIRIALGWEYEQYVVEACDTARRFMLDTRERVHIAVDADGEGGRVCQQFMNYIEGPMVESKVQFDLIRVYNGQDARYLRNDYNHVVDEATLALAEWFAEGGSIPYDAKLEAELQFAKWNVRRRVRNNRMMDLSYVTPKDGKDGFRSVLGRSPDRLDTLRVMAWARLVLGLDVRGRVEPAQEPAVPEGFSPVSSGIVVASHVDQGQFGESRQARISAEFSARMSKIAAQRGR